MRCRFAGNVCRFWSAADHALLCRELVCEAGGPRARARRAAPRQPSGADRRHHRPRRPAPGARRAAPGPPPPGRGDRDRARNPPRPVRAPGRRRRRPRRRTPRGTRPAAPPRPRATHTTATAARRRAAHHQPRTAAGEAALPRRPPPPHAGAPNPPGPTRARTHDSATRGGPMGHALPPEVLEQLELDPCPPREPPGSPPGRTSTPTTRPTTPRRHRGARVRRRGGARPIRRGAQRVEHGRRGRATGGEQTAAASAARGGGHGFGVRSPRRGLDRAGLLLLEPRPGATGRPRRGMRVASSRSSSHCERDRM
jgi:hypothetical protein